MLGHVIVFINWFLKEIRSITPNWLSALILGKATPLNVIVRAESTEFSGGKSDISVPEAYLSSQQNTTVSKIQDANVFLPTHLALERSLTVPQVSRANVDNIARLDIIRRTPFNLADIFWTQRINKTSGKELPVQQFIVEKKMLRQYENSLLQNGFRVKSFYLGAPNQALFLATATQDKAKNNNRIFTLNKLLAATAAVLGVIFLGNQAFENQQRLDDLTAQSELLKQEAISLRKEIEGRQATLDIANKRAQFIYNRHKLSTVLRDITIALPDHTWVSNVNYSKTNVSIIGATSESSADLVLQLAKVNRIQNPQLIGSVSKNQSGAEKFELRYNLEAFK